MFGVFINVGSSSYNPSGRGRILKDYRFEFLPIPEMRKTSDKIPTYRDLGFSRVKFPDLQVHLDPEFETFTYGHVRRGFGDIANLTKMKKDDCLFLYATLENEDGWAPYIIGYFRNPEVFDCRRLTNAKILSLKSKGFGNCAHLKRVDPHVDLLIKGGVGSKRLLKAFPMAEEGNNLALAKRLDDLVLTSTSKKVKSGAPWFRWTLTSSNAEELLEMIEAWQRV